MGQLIVRNLDEELVLALKRRAARHGRSAVALHLALWAGASAGGLTLPIRSLRWTALPLMRCSDLNGPRYGPGHD